MRKLIIATAAALVLGAPLALAADAVTATPFPNKPIRTHQMYAAASTLPERCTALGAQFDKAEATHKTNKNYARALNLRNEAQSMCSTHQAGAGIKKIESALTMIGLKPMKG
ncbi:hypothetical protein [Dongia deserti]|uniref:hypothetical protein n=1 Tax=Dongia deserti TaxID=2268030 RepID=UPI000E65895B|nr:hypothetical protein [Dongia deserti]